MITKQEQRTVTVYVAEDGTKFDDKQKCIAYEQEVGTAEIEANKLLVNTERGWCVSDLIYPSYYDGTFNACGDDWLTVYKIDTEDDLQTLMHYLTVSSPNRPEPEDRQYVRDLVGKKVIVGSHYEGNGILGTKETLLEQLSDRLDELLGGK